MTQALVVVEDKEALDGADWKVLYEQFANIKTQIPRGVCQDYFLSVDATVLKMFKDSNGGFIRLATWDAAFDPSRRESDNDGSYPGVVGLPVEHLIYPVYSQILEGRNPLPFYYL